MRALTLRQPWASLWLRGPKVHETRAYRTHYGGWLLVHAAKATGEVDAAVDAVAAREFGEAWRDTLPRGALIGAVRVVDFMPTGMASKLVTPDDRACGDFTPGRWAWRRDFAIAFIEPVPCSGKLNVFKVDDELVRDKLPRGVLP